MKKTKAKSNEGRRERQFRNVLLVIARTSCEFKSEVAENTDDAEVSRDPLWSRKLAYSLLHFLQRLSSPRFHARQLKSLINMQREPGEEKTCRGDDRPADAKKREKEEILGKERWKKVVLDQQQAAEFVSNIDHFFRFINWGLYYQWRTCVYIFNFYNN